MAVFVPNGNFARTFHAPAGEVGRWLRGESRRVAYVSKTFVGKGGSGKLAKSIKAGKVHKVGLNLTVKVEADARSRGAPTSYAYVHHEGSRPHVIVPSTPGGVLHWGGARGPTVVIV